MNPADARFSCKIGELPDELWLEILAHLTPIRGFLSSMKEVERLRQNRKRVKTLHSLTQLCRKMHALSKPFLYQSVIQTDNNWYLPTQFLRTVVDKPELVQHVQYIENQNSYRSPNDPLDTLPKDLWDKITNASKSPAWASRVESIAKFFCCGQSWSQRAMFVLIRLAENLTELALGDASVYMTSLVYTRLENNQNIRRMWTGTCDYVTGLPEFIITATPNSFQTPVLDFLRFYQMEKSLALSKRHLPSQNGGEIDIGLEEITLNNFHMKPRELSNFLKPCDSLQHFKCRWGLRHSQRRLAERIDLEQLREDLSRFRHSLQSLVLDTLESVWLVSLDEHIPTIGTLRDFTALKHLDVSGLVLWSDDETVEHPPLASILPASLETLVIHVEWDDYVEESLIGLSNDCASQLPRLKSIDCSWRPAPSDVAEALTAVFKDVGVELKLSCAEDL